MHITNLKPWFKKYTDFGYDVKESWIGSRIWSLLDTGNGCSLYGGSSPPLPCSITNGLA